MGFDEKRVRGIEFMICYDSLTYKFPEFSDPTMISIDLRVVIYYL